MLHVQHRDPANSTTSDDVRFGAFELRMSRAMQNFLGRAGLCVWAWTPAKETAIEFVSSQCWLPYHTPARLKDKQAEAYAHWLERIAVTGRTMSSALELSCENKTRLSVRLSAEFGLEQIVGVSIAQTPLLSRVKTYLTQARAPL